MVDVKQYLKSSGGNWLRADHVKVGDKLKVLTPGTIDDKSFDRAYLVLNVTLMRTGEEYQLRMGPKNVNRVAESFKETDTNKWVNKLLEVVSIETYAGLGQKGMNLRGTASNTTQQTQMLNPETIDAIRKSRDIIDMGVPLSESDFTILPAGVRAELLRHGLVEKKDDLYFFSDKAKKYLG